MTDKVNQFHVDQKVKIKDKNFFGKIAFVGTTDFAEGKWIGVHLDQALGRHNGTLQGRCYFECPPSHGIFVRPIQVQCLDESINANNDSSKRLPSSPARTPSKTCKIPGPQRSSIPSRITQPAFTNFKDSLSSENDTVATATEKSFVQSGFVENTKTSSNKSDAMIPKTPTRTSVGTLSTQVSFDSATSSKSDVVKDLEEKLETLKMKRAKDMEKIRDFERLKIQNDQLLEFKTQIMSSQNTLQKEILKLKKEASDAIQSRNEQEDELQDLSDSVEMLTLDKEMAEEKVETLQLELDAMNTKCEELQVDFEILKAEMSDNVNNSTDQSTPSSFESKQLTSQNEKLRTTLVDMRDLLAAEKCKNMSLAKDVEEKNKTLDNLRETNDKLKVLNETLESNIADLTEQVDAALGAEEMVENLTVKCLDMEENLLRMKEEKDDLEKLYDMNEELQENSKEIEQQLRLDLERCEVDLCSLRNEHQQQKDTIVERESTIVKFKDVVNKMQEYNNELKEALHQESLKPQIEADTKKSTALAMENFNKIFVQSKWIGNALDIELTRVDLQYYKCRCVMIAKYLPDKLMISGEMKDMQAIHVLLILPRLKAKVEMLLTHSQRNVEQHGGDESTDGVEEVSDHVQNMSRILYINLEIISFLTSQIGDMMNRVATVDQFLHLHHLYSDLATFEVCVDQHIERIRNKISLTNSSDHVQQLSECAFFLFSEMLFKPFTNVQVNGKLLDDWSGKLSNLISYSSQILISVVDQIECYVSSNNKSTSVDNMTKSHHQTLFSNIVLPKMFEIVSKLENVKSAMKGKDLVKFKSSGVVELSFIVKACQTLVDLSEISNTFVKFHGWIETFVSRDTENNNADEINIVLFDDCIDVSADNETDWHSHCTSHLTKVASDVSDVLSEVKNNKFTMQSDSVKPSHQQRAEDVKHELFQSDCNVTKLEHKEQDIRELKMIVRSQVEQISEMQIRKDLAEKRVKDFTRELECEREKFERKVSDLTECGVRRQVDWEDNLKRLRIELDKAEVEKGDLKTKLKDMHKRLLLRGITEQVQKVHIPSATTQTQQHKEMGSSPTPSNNSSLVSTRESNASQPNSIMLGHSSLSSSVVHARQVESLRLQVIHLEGKLREQKFADLFDRVMKLKPLHNSSSPEKQNVSDHQLIRFKRDACALEYELKKSLVSSIPILDDTKNKSTKSGNPHTNQEGVNLFKMELKTAQLQTEIERQYSSKVLSASSINESRDESKYLRAKLSFSKSSRHSETSKPYLVTFNQFQSIQNSLIL